MSLRAPIAPDGQAFERCMSVGGVAVFPSDTVYGLACDAQSRVAVERLYRLKRRPLDKPSAVMFFSLELALAAIPELGERTRDALARLMPGPVSVLLPNTGRRFPLACGADTRTLGLRVPDLPAFASVAWPVLQSSANLAGGPEARALGEVPVAIRRAADMVIDGGVLPGTASTVIDLRRYEAEGGWEIVRQGMVSDGTVADALAGQFHFDPSGYDAEIRDDLPAYDALQDAVVAAGLGASAGVGASAAFEAPAGRGASAGPGGPVQRILELGTGTGETARRLLAAHPGAVLTGVDTSAPMLSAARARLPAERVELRVGRLEDPLPEGPFDLVATALCVHHLDAAGKRDLFARIRRVLAPGGRFVLGDVVVPEDPADVVASLTPGYDQPSSLDDQLGWLRGAGFTRVRATWTERDLAVVVAECS